MNMKIKLLFAVVFTFPIIVDAADWTNYGKIIEIAQQPSSSAYDVDIQGTFTANPTKCNNGTWFSLSVSDKKSERMFAMLLSAAAAGKDVRLYVTDTCSPWGSSIISGVYIKGS